MVDEPVDRRDRHGGIGEDGVPGAERLVCGDHDRAAFVSRADELEEDRGLRLAFLDVGEIVEDQQAVFVELLDGGGQAQFLARGLELLDEIGGAGEQDAVPGLDEGVAEGGAQMRLADPGRSERRILVPVSSQLSPWASAVILARLTIGTAAKSKVSSVLPTGRRASAR